MGKNPVVRLAWYLPMVPAIVLILWMLRPIDGNLGHDYAHFFPRIYLGALHFWQNGWAVPHYSPALGGGLPFFADPQSVYYSLPQFLTFVLDPLLAMRITVAIFAALGYLGFVALARGVFHLRTPVSHLAALAFTLNGFSFAHLYVGHFTHHSFWLFPWVLLVFFSPKVGRAASLRHAVLFSLAVIYTFYSGGLHVLVVFAAALAVSFPAVLWVRAQNGELMGMMRFLLFSLLFISLSCSGKFLASYFYSDNFFMQEIHTSTKSPLTLAFQYYWFDPESTPQTLPFGRWDFGPWEYVGFVSKATMVAFFLFPFVFVAKLTRRNGILFGSGLVLSLALVYLSGGALFNKSLPFFRHYHNPLKLLGSFIPFLILIAAFLLEKFLRGRAFTLGVCFVGGVLLLCEFTVYARFFLETPQHYYFKYSPDVYQKLKSQGKLARVTTVAREGGLEIERFSTGMTSQEFFEPLFGYRSEAFLADLQPGPAALVSDGRFNLTHPGCFIYPTYFNCAPWDRIPASDAPNFERFVKGSSEAFGVPLWQNVLLWGNALAILLQVFFVTQGSLYKVWMLIIRGSRRVPIPALRRDTTESTRSTNCL